MYSPNILVIPKEDKFEPKRKFPLPGMGEGEYGGGREEENEMKNGSEEHLEK